MTLDTSLHETKLFRVLKDIYSDTTISPFLGFKGGTAALMFYDLDRFSVDLDFDLLDETKETYVLEKVKAITKSHGILKEAFKKRFNLFFLFSYEKGAHKVKIEINRRQFGSKYEMKTYLGVSMLVMVKEDMFAHKLMAMHERMTKTSRDIYDVWFFLKQGFPINKELIEKRLGMTCNALFLICIDQLEKMSNRNILNGLGELLTTSQKDWARVKLKEETIAFLTLRLENKH